MSPRVSSAARRRDELGETRPGPICLPDVQVTEHHRFARACNLVPRGVICLLFAHFLPFTECDLGFSYSDLASKSGESDPDPRRRCDRVVSLSGSSKVNQVNHTICWSLVASVARAVGSQ